MNGTVAKLLRLQNKLRLAFLLLIVVIELICVWSYNTTPISSDNQVWLSEYRTNKNDPVSTNALPVLIDAIAKKPSTIERWMDDLQDQAHERFGMDTEKWPSSLPSAGRTSDRKSEAFYLINQLGVKAKNAIPTLIHILNDPSEDESSRESALTDLDAMSSELAPFVSQITPALSDPSANIQVSTVKTLARIGPQAKSSLPALLPLTVNQDEQLMVEAGNALWQIDQQTNLAVQIFTNALHSTNPPTIQTALSYLHEMKSSARGAVSALELYILQPYVPHEWNLAEKMLTKLDPGFLESLNNPPELQLEYLLPIILQKLSTDPEHTLWPSLGALPVFGTNAIPAIPVLIQILATYNPPPRLMVGLAYNHKNAAAYDLGLIGPPASNAIPILKAARDSLPMAERFPLIEALSRIDPTCNPEDRTNLDYWPAKYETLELRAQMVRWRMSIIPDPPMAELNRLIKLPDLDPNTIIFIGEITPPATNLLPDLKKFLTPAYSLDTRRAAAIAIRKIDPAEADRLHLPGLLALP